MTTNELDAANILRGIPEIEAAKLAAQGLRFMRKDKEAPLEVARRQARTAETVVDARIVGMRKAKIEVEPVIAQAREAHAAMVTHGREVDEVGCFLVIRYRVVEWLHRKIGLCACVLGGVLRCIV